MRESGAQGGDNGNLDAGGQIWEGARGDKVGSISGHQRGVSSGLRPPGCAQSPMDTTLRRRKKPWWKAIW